MASAAPGVDHLGRPDVASVDGQVRASQRVDRLRPHEPVRVRDDTDDDLVLGNASYAGERRNWKLRERKRKICAILEVMKPM